VNPGPGERSRETAEGALPRSPLKGAPRALVPGDVVAGKFVVERTIGVGGMGHVFAARHSELGTLVAIKVVHANSAHDAESVTRFKREARAIASLRSEHVVRVHDVGETEAGVPYMIMEYLEGADTGSILLSRGAPFPVDEAITYVVQACEALAEAHAAGIVHRDLKPQNLFVVTRPSGPKTIRVLDFGLVKALDGNGRELGAGGFDARLTRTGEFVGTPQFMAPEQFRGAADARTDVWGMGACLYRLLTAEYPFPGESLAIICTSVLTAEPTPMHRIRPEVPFVLDQVVARCLRKDPNERFATMHDLAAALRRARAALADDGPTLFDGGPAHADGFGSSPDLGSTQRVAPPVMQSTLPLRDSTPQLPSVMSSGPYPAAPGSPRPATSGVPTMPRPRGGRAIFLVLPLLLLVAGAAALAIFFFGRPRLTAKPVAMVATAAAEPPVGADVVPAPPATDSAAAEPAPIASTESAPTLKAAHAASASGASTSSGKKAERPTSAAPRGTSSAARTASPRAGGDVYDSL
jgi:serine/threonine protein kinase